MRKLLISTIATSLLGGGYQLGWIWFFRWIAIKIEGKVVMKALNLLSAALLLSGLGFSSDSFGAASSNAQTHSGGGVTVAVSYLNPGTVDPLRFQVMLDTHSGNLDAYDLKKITVLRDSAGKAYAPTAVETKGSGHHRQATVTFPILNPGVRSVELVIKDVAGVKERSFRWALK